MLNNHGNIVDTEGKILGRHKGIENFTVGQRKGIGISASMPLYVLKIDNINNQVVVGEHKFLKKRRLIAKELKLFSDRLPEKAKAKIRYNQLDAWCSIKTSDDDLMEVIFDEPQEAITPGQSIVFYGGKTVLGGAVIFEC